MPLRDDLLNPIPGDNPSGTNLRYAPVYDKIKEARRQEDDAPQGEWQRERKVADYKLVIKLAGETLATQSKDLQLAAWLTEAFLHQEGFSGLQQGLGLLRGLVENFWDTLYPEIEDGDLELRSAPLEWVGTRLDDPVRKAPLTRGGFSYYKFKESRTVGSEEDAAQSDQKREAREAAIADGKVTLEEFEKDSAETPTAQYEAWVAAMDGSLESIDSLRDAVRREVRQLRAQFHSAQDGARRSSQRGQSDSAKAAGPGRAAARAGRGRSGTAKLVEESGK